MRRRGRAVAGRYRLCGRPFRRFDGDVRRQPAVADPGGQRRLVARHSGKCMDLPSSSQGEDVQFKQYPCNGGQNQQFARAAL
ncbi:RICIN domain-containing protein [Nonomuraea jiangxiensis]|uniref:RICIN domain-containing protein n=1 Tax=Nonomuraea jiangxiensis TaxID=633440 RepID=UPI000B86C3F5|nr:RICIN domain-containing protein [Nonomuraea jiangxiensis]